MDTAKGGSIRCFDIGAEGMEKCEIIPCEVDETSECSSPTSPVSAEDSLEADLVEILETLPVGMNEQVPNWFKQFFSVYRFNERRKYLMLRQMQLQMIDFEIKKCELLKDIIERLKN